MVAGIVRQGYDEPVFKTSRSQRTMKTLAAFAVLLVLAVVPSRADDKITTLRDEIEHLQIHRGDEDKGSALQGEIELLQIQQDVDKTLLREAMMVAGRARFVRMADRPDTDEAKKRAAVEAEVVEVFIREKQEAVLRRTAELKKKANELSAARMKANPPVKPDDKDRPELIEKLEEARVEVQLLLMQSQMFQKKLNEALNPLFRTSRANIP